MRAEDDAGWASAALALLLEGRCEPLLARGVEWRELLRLAEGNAILLRLADGLEREGLRGPSFFVQAVRTERGRVKRAVEALERVGRCCASVNIPFIFAKAFHHYPDMGGDLDLFVASAASRGEPGLAAALNASVEARGVADYLAGTTKYRLEGCETPLEIHCGRLGSAGEHVSYVSTLIERGREADVAGGRYLIPSPEDQLILQGLQRVYGRRSIRVADMAHAISLLRAESLDWDYIAGTSRQLGTSDGLGCFLSYTEQVHQHAFGRGLVPAGLRRRVKLDGWGRVTFKGGRFRFRTVSVSARVYFGKLRSAVRGRRWGAAGRLCLIPMAAGLASFNRLGRRGG